LESTVAIFGGINRPFLFKCRGKTNLVHMTVKKNVLFVVKKRFINMEKDEENAASVERLSESKMGSV